MLRVLAIAAFVATPAFAQEGEPLFEQGVNPLFEQDAGGESGEVAPAPTSVPRADETPRIDNNVAVFSGLDKITGRITEFDVWIGETVQFGVLQVTPRVCYSRPQTERPRTSSFVEVDEVTLDRKMKRIFTGWVFAESPGLNAMEHPVNDVWLKGCRITSAVAAPPGFVMRSPEPEQVADPNAPRAGDASDDLALDPGQPIEDGEAQAPSPGSPQTLEEFLALPDEPLD